jgi:hypothetical protein
MTSLRLASLIAGVVAGAASTGALVACTCPSGGWAVQTIKLVDGGTDAEADAACEVCGDAADCTPTVTDAGPAVICVYGESFDTECIGGRRPARLRAPIRARATTAAGRYFARLAHLEAASVDAFEILARELGTHGAPRSLIRSAERARRDEIRHARVATALAARFGAEPRAPRVARGAERSLEAITRENAVEGCVRETWGALVATWQARAAEDRRVRAAMTRIAIDETRHAALAWRVHRWACRRLDPVARRRVERSRDRALAALVASAKAPAPPELVRVAGLPDAAVAERLVEGFRDALFG